MKDCQNVGGRVAGLQMGHQRMREKAFLCLFLILIHGNKKDGAELGRRVGCGRHLLGHDGKTLNGTGTDETASKRNARIIATRS